MIGRFLAVALCISGGPLLAQGTQIAERMALLGAVPCAGSSLTCLTLPMARDHDDPASGTVPITFGLRPADGESRAIVFVATGGPGTAGLGLADGYLGPLSADLLAGADFVFFDQRGTGPVHGVTCPKAEARLAMIDVSIARPDEAIAAARAYATDCVAETADPAILPHLGTEQAIRDLETFRQAIGAPRVWIYGESYGTQFAQAYATAYPEAIAGVILDGVVDLNLSSEAFYREYTLASEAILDRLFAACDADAACAAEMGGPAAEAYAALESQLRTAPLTVDFPLGAGGTAPRDLTASMLEMNAFYALYGTDGRADFLRALAAAAQGNPVQMLRLAYYNLYVDGDSQEFLSDPTWFPSAYYAINCLDYGPEGATPEEAAARIVAESQALVLQAPRLASSYMIERLVCAFWPHQGAEGRPGPFAGGDYPTLILNSDADPITPVHMAYEVFDNVRNGHLVVMQGGPHVIWGRGLACPDAIFDELVLNGQAPAAPVQLCEQDLTTGYRPLSIPDGSDPFALAAGVEETLDLYPEVYGWYADVPLAVGCDHGGRVTITADNSGWSYAFEGCALWPGLTMDGRGRWQDAGGPKDGFTLDVTVSGAVEGDILFRRDARTEASWVAGTWNGAPVSTPRPMP